jgi:hypothetical protein
LIINVDGERRFENALTRTPDENADGVTPGRERADEKAGTER